MMLRRLYSRIPVCLVVLTLLLTAREASAQFQLRLEQSGFASKTVTDNGPGDANPAVGRITVTGAYGTFNINITTGLSKPVLGNGTSQATIDLNSTDFSTPAGGTLTITLADTGFNFPNNNAGNQMTLTSQVGGTLAGLGVNPIPPGSSVTFTSWVHTADTSPLAVDPTVIPVGSVSTPVMGPYSTGSYTENTPGVNFTKGAGPYSMFSQAVLTMTGAGRVGFDHLTRVEGQNCSGKLGNFVWNDLNRNGIQESGEPGIPGITVNLIKDGNPSATTTTDGSGLYQFTGLCAASYTVVIPSQAGLTGYVASPTLQGGDPGTDSNPNPTTVIFANDNEDDQTIDFGYYIPAPHLTLSKDPKNGTFSQGAPVSFNFVIGNDGGSPATNVMLTDQLPGNGGLQWMVAPGNPSQGSCTISGSNFLSCNLGTIPPAQFVTLTITSVGTGTPPAACQAQPNPIALVTGDGGLSAQDSGSWNCVPPQLSIVKTPKAGTFAVGAQVSFTIVVSNPAPAGASPATNVTLTDLLPGNGGLVWETATTSQGTCTLTSNDLSCALGTIAPGASVTVTVNSTATTPVDACQLQPNPSARATADGGLDVQDSGSLDCVRPASLGDFVWHDLNANGIQEGGEPGIGGVAVTLLKCDGTPTGMTTTTDANGLYLFPNLTPDCYKVQFATPAGFTPSAADQGSNDAADSDSSGGLTGNYTLAPGDNNLTVDAGFYQVPPLTAACPANASGQVGVAYSSAIVATGGTAPYTFSLNSGSLPPGLVLNPNTGAITGTPTAAGAFGFTVKVTDSTGAGAMTAITPNCGITVAPPPMTATCVAAGVGQGGVPYSSSIGVTGGTAPYTFALASGSLPAGLTLNASTGAVTGTPTAAGAFSFSVMVTDSTPGVHAVATTSNCGITIAPPPPDPCIPKTFSFTGNTSTYGTAGNIRNFAVSGVSVKASAFSRTESTGSWSTAFLGSYSGGLGVTDGSEGTGANNTHKVDNIGGRDNYVLFEFSSPVTVNRAFLDAIGGDSDISVWIGTKSDPYNNHLTLSDALLSTLVYDEELTTSTSTSRWADINGGSVSGNVLVIAALANDDSPEDEFKISKLDISCPTPPPPCTGKIGDRVWKDLNNNGIQDSGEAGIAGVTVQLKDGATVVATTTTDANGNYLFTGLCADTYTVVIPSNPTGYNPSPILMGTNRSIDSNGSPTTVTLPANDSTDLTIDFGFVPSTPSPCVPTTFTFTGSSSTSGTAGNIRNFTSNGISVKASAFSRTDSGGSWSTAYLGLYGPGLGVTDGSEGNGADDRHKVDNIGGRDNYVLFEFSSVVTINRALLDYIGTDSDLSVWIGTRTDPYNNHLTLSDSLLSSLAYEENHTTSTANYRWADINAGSVSGNVLVIAALANDDSPEDAFKISKLDVLCPQPTNCSGTIGDYVWKDSNGNGIQNSGEPGIGGVTVQLKKNGTVIATTTTNSNGFYQFTGLCSGTYSVVIPTTPTGFTASPSLVGSDRSVDSNGSSPSVTLAANNSTDQSIDFGYVPSNPNPCVPTRFTFTGNSATSGTAGNTRTFTVNGISVKVTAFSRTSSGSWSSAFLGMYGPGLGVTDSSEGTGSYGSHKVDNKGRMNFVLFEFASPVVVNQAFLDAIGDDADLSIFVGTKTDPYNNHLTLSDSLLMSMTYEENPTSSTGDSRWADFNNTGRSGNVLVLAAMVTDDTPEDEFKISKLDITCP
jgi:uncharacterized repeat protein (TIGR01451 family)